jgi:hypothetical protein
MVAAIGFVAFSYTPLVDATFINGIAYHDVLNLRTIPFGYKPVVPCSIKRYGTGPVEIDSCYFGPRLKGKP